MSAIELVPVTPDPKKNYRTALVLVLVMIVGGIMILKAYEKRTRETDSDDRPSFVTQISETKDLRYLRQDGKQKELMELKGKVVLVQVTPMSGADPVTSAVMQRFSKEYAGNEDLVLLTLMLDPGDAEGLKEQLEVFSKKLGAELPQWVVATNERPTLHKFIKNEFKANMLPHQADGKWVYDHSLVLIDRNRHVRKAVVPQKHGGASFVTSLDFEQAMKWDDEGIKTGTELSNEQQMEVLLGETIKILLGEKVSENKGGNSLTAVVCFGIGFVLFVILLIFKSRAQRMTNHPA
ncbi:MAG: hypothetical protein NWT08_14040 [Akkermansiaceae bacterium]|jgi:cytochrome oxidase Cu insertion factor (SCO1/SenC/PrrC family)|nr:hypothetical protein [Akkermansiaceae bacterium]MDP4647142.1 hypothetical protein [Akkermansiaceae bacterium]MDP4722612.1 hypothetical protein [Akkermansiaceae bacterium]MDP4847753.1 hypothetical protein [Akkermansiaceae bacterium]MDP4897293.1 hypothetical protein [Akkermansiaceae bacterium]